MMKIHHVGYLIKNIEKAQLQFRKLGFLSVSTKVYDKKRDIDIIFMEKDGYCIELVSPKSPDSIVYNMMKKYKNMPYHICYESNDIEKDLRDLENNGFLRIDDLCEAPAIGGKRVCFLQNLHIGMIELVEE